jgi:hypothetical protein
MIGKKTIHLSFVRIGAVPTIQGINYCNQETASQIRFPPQKHYKPHETLKEQTTNAITPMNAEVSNTWTTPTNVTSMGGEEDTSSIGGENTNSIGG